jgi:hypothetical protein
MRSRRRPSPPRYEDDGRERVGDHEGRTDRDGLLDIVPPCRGRDKDSDEKHGTPNMTEYKIETIRPQSLPIMAARPAINSNRATTRMTGPMSRTCSIQSPQPSQAPRGGPALRRSMNPAPRVPPSNISAPMTIHSAATSATTRPPARATTAGDRFAVTSAVRQTRDGRAQSPTASALKTL